MAPLGYRLTRRSKYPLSCLLEIGVYGRVTLRLRGRDANRQEQTPIPNVSSKSGSRNRNILVSREIGVLERSGNGVGTPSNQGPDRRSIVASLEPWESPEMACT